jgi:crotonobetainyl-CoA:carnitine CoA-transferase CaiB-like acyl-CoA transferase
MTTVPPLADARVIEFCQIAAGPFGGDGMRAWPPHSNGFSENFASLNRNKRSVVLNLKDPADLATARRLCLMADVVLENFRPGVMERLGLGYEALAAHKPALVYCSISAYGQLGPRAQEGGFDVTLQAAGGVMSVTGEPDGGPVKCGVPLTDFAAGLYAAYAIASALLGARRSGEGARIDVPMLGTTLAIAALQTSEYFGTGRDPRRLGSAHPRNAPYQAFKARDGHFVLAAGNDDLFRRTCEGAGCPDLVNDPRFATTTLRARNQEALRVLLEARFAAFSAQECLSIMREQGVPCAPINSYSQALADAQVAHYGWVQPLALPGGTTTRTFVSPLGRGAPVRRPPPALGEHTDEIRKEVSP